MSATTATEGAGGLELEQDDALSVLTRVEPNRLLNDRFFLSLLLVVQLVWLSALGYAVWLLLL